MRLALSSPAEMSQRRRKGHGPCLEVCKASSLHQPEALRYDGSMNETKTERIASNPEVCGGKPCIAGTRMRVQDIYVWHELQGQSADEIVSSFPHLTMADVYAALSYYWDHRDEIQRQMDEATAFVEQMKQKHSSPLQQKLARKDAPNHPLPS